MTQKTNRLHFSTRTVAMVLSIVMLIGSIATGSMLNTFAAYMKDAAANSDALSQAATEGGDIALNAIPSEDNAAQQDDEAAKAEALSDFEENEIVKNLKKDVFGDDEIKLTSKGDVDLSATGYGTADFYLQDQYGQALTDQKGISLESNEGTVEFDVSSYQGQFLRFYIKGDGNDQYGIDNSTTSQNYVSNGSKFNLGKGVNPGYYKVGNSADKVTFNFKVTGNSDGNTIEVSETTSSTTENTWTVAGDNTALFGTAWDTANTANDMTRQSDGTYVITYSNVMLKKGDIKFKVVKNHAWTTAYPASNKVVTVSEADYYNVTITYDPNNNNSVTASLEHAAKYTFTLDTTENATVTATYGKTTINEGGHIDDIPVGVSVSVNITPDSGYKTKSVTSDDPSATITGTGDKRTVTMPAGNVTVTAAVEKYQAEMKRVYFYNKFTQYPMVIIYAYHKSGTTITDEIFGSGRTMTKMDNSDIWYIDLPNDAYIVFKGEGYSTGELEPLANHPNKPKYIPGSDRTEPGTGGDWGEYIDRSNVYSVTNGSTMAGENLFTGINATFYDYYVDGEVADGWLTGIKGDEYNIGTENQGWKWLPYGTLNQALSDYADNTHSPMNDTTYPLYFGNLNYDDNASEVSNLYHFKKRANNSDGLDPASTAITGLTGQTLTGSNTDIHHYKNGATNENGASMAIFDEDFLSGNNSQGKQLATILHSPSFPVRKNDSVKAIYANTANVSFSAGEKLYAHFWKSATDSINVEGAKNGNVYSFTIPDGYTNVLFYKASSIGGAWSYKTKDITTLPTAPNIQAKLDIATDKEVTWEAPSVTTTTHTYYEYDSTGGKDNAFITNINTTNKTADIDYYPNSAHYAESNSGTKGFFPFDYNNVLQRYTTKRVYLKVTDHWDKDNARFAAYFNGGGVTQQWKSMYNISGTKIYWCDIPSGATQNTTLIFCRMDGSKQTNNWDNKWNQTKDLKCPFDTSVNLFSLNTAGVVDSDWTDAGSWSVYSGNNSSSIGTYASNSETAASHYAHDQGFGMKLEIPFTIGEYGLNDDGTAQQFNFSGDDDLWVFVDNNLVLDLGGAHAATTGSINFNTMTATANSAAKMDTTSGPTRNSTFGGSGATKWFDNTNPDKIHTMTIYYMERGMFDSNLKFGYSFHAIPNLLQVEKKVRTTSDDAYIKVNSGFFANNNQSGDDSNMSDLYIDNGERQVTLFEKAFQADTFGITQNYPDELPDGNTKLEYTIGETKTEAHKNSDNNFEYTLQNNNDGDRIANFNGQIKSGDSITLSETINDETNQFRYNPSIIVYDDARVVNGKSYQFDPGDGTTIGTYKANNDGSYTFNFKPSEPVTSGGIEDLRLRARFQNQMKCHDLTLKKVVNTGSPQDDFTFEIKFKFDNGYNDNYIAYPLEINGTNTKLSDNGTVTLKANQSITMSGIPENAQVQIREINNETTYAYTSTTVTTETGDDVADVTEVTTQDGVQFKMADENVDVEVKNATGEPVFISHSLHPESTGTGGTYVTVDVLDENDTVLQTYNKTNNVIKVDASYITYNSTDKLRIVLDSYPDHYNEFMDFYEQISDTMRELEAAGSHPTYTVTRSDETGVYQATITIAVKDLFNDKRAQLYTELPFYSKFGKQLVINHHLDVEHSDEGTDGDTFLRVEVLDASSNPVWYSPDNIDTNYTQNGDIVVPAKYFWNDADNSNKYKLKVWLRTDLKGFSQFNDFTILGRTFKEERTDAGATVTLTSQTEARKQFGTITFAMTKLFDGSTPLVSELPYLSQLYIPDYKYNFKYTYPAYVKSYGYQSFTVDEPFTSDELRDYMKLNNGLLVFQDTEKERNFINAHTPYEDNFQKDVSIVEYTSSHSDQGYTIGYDITMKNTDEQLTVDFNFPYHTNTAAGDSYAYYAQNGVVDKLSDGAVNTVRRNDVYGRSWISYNDCRFPHLVTETNKPQFIKAPLIIHDTDSNKDLYFKYWRVETIKKYNTEVREYTRCYDYEFNLSIFQDCTVTPIYGEEDFGSRGMPNPPTTYNMYNRFDPDVNRAHYKDNTVSITFIENSRNQHNNCDYGEICVVDENTGKITSKTGTKGNTPTSRQGAADRVYSDFLLTFDNVIDGDSTVVLRDRYKNQPNVMKAGLIIQAVGDIETEDGKPVPKTDTYYSNNQNYAGYSTEAIKKYLEGDSSSGVSGVGKTEFDVTELDNKNRAQVYYGINAAKPHTQEAEIANPLAPLDTSVNKTKVYKAFAYIGNVDGNKLSNVIVSPKPVYFTIYIDASINPGESLPEGYFTLSANNNNGN